MEKDYNAALDSLRRQILETKADEIVYTSNDSVLPLAIDSWVPTTLADCHGLATKRLAHEPLLDAVKHSSVFLLSARALPGWIHAFGRKVHLFAVAGADSPVLPPTEPSAVANLALVSIHRAIDLISVMLGIYSLSLSVKLF